MMKRSEVAILAQRTLMMGPQTAKSSSDPAAWLPRTRVHGCQKPVPEHLFVPPAVKLKASTCVLVSSALLVRLRQEKRPKGKSWDCKLFLAKCPKWPFRDPTGSGKDLPILAKQGTVAPFHHLGVHRDSVKNPTTLPFVARLGRAPARTQKTNFENWPAFPPSRRGIFRRNLAVPLLPLLRLLLRLLRCPRTSAGR